MKKIIQLVMSQLESIHNPTGNYITFATSKPLPRPPTPKKKKKKLTKPIMGQAPKGRTQKPTCQLPHKLQQRQLPEEKKTKNP